MNQFIDKLSFTQRQRLQFIETILIWEGEVRRQDVCDVFNVTLNHLTRDISSYRKTYKDQLRYDPEIRAWRPGSRFIPIFASGSPSEYLSSLHAYAVSRNSAVIPTIGHLVPLETMPAAPETITHSILSEIIKSIRQEFGLKVQYLTLTDPEPVQNIIWPHAMFFSGGRWMLRAFDNTRKEFCDFVLARITYANQHRKAAPVIAANDSRWHKLVKIEIVPSTQLSEAQQRLVAKEFDMSGNYPDFVWTIEIRECLVGYFLYYYRLDLPDAFCSERLICLKSATQ